METIENSIRPKSRAAEKKAARDDIKLFWRRFAIGAGVFALAGSAAYLYNEYSEQHNSQKNTTSLDMDGDGIPNEIDIDPLLNNSMVTNQGVEIIPDQPFSVGEQIVTFALENTPRGLRFFFDPASLTQMTYEYANYLPQQSISLQISGDQNATSHSTPSISLSTQTQFSPDGTQVSTDLNWQINSQEVQVAMKDVFLETVVGLFMKHGVSNDQLPFQMQRIPEIMGRRGWTLDRIRGLDADGLCTVAATHIVTEEYIEIPLMNYYASQHPLFLNAAQQAKADPKSDYTYFFNEAVLAFLQTDDVAKLYSDGTSTIDSPQDFLADKLSFPFVLNAVSTVIQGKAPPIIRCEGVTDKMLIDSYRSLLVSYGYENNRLEYFMKALEDTLQKEQQLKVENQKKPASTPKMKPNRFADKEQRMLDKAFGHLEQYQQEQMLFMYNNSLNRHQRRALLQKTRREKLSGGKLLQFIEQEVGVKGIIEV